MKMMSEVSREDIPVERVYGIESEYPVDDKLLIRAATYSYQPLPGLYSVNTFLSNGARLYYDMGTHLEYSTPECLDIKDVVAAYLAGERVLMEVKERSGSNATLNSRIVDDRGQTWASHENYLTRPDIDPRKGSVAYFITSHGVARNIITGSGSILKSPRDGVSRFHISQKAHLLDEVANINCSRVPKPFINTREKPLADVARFRRIHVVGGDPTMSPWALAVRMGSMSLVLRMMEHNRLLNKNLNEYTLKDPITAAAILAEDTKLQHKVEMVDGKDMTLLDFELRLSSLAMTVVEKVEVPDSERLVAQKWHDALEKVLEEKSTDFLLNKTEWVAKNARIQRNQEISDVAVRELKDHTVDMRWGDLDELGTAKHLRDDKKFFEDPFGSVAAADQLVLNAPKGRAAIRARAVKEIYHLRRSEIPYKVSWEHIDIGEEEIELENPYGISASKRHRMDYVIDSAIQFAEKAGK